MALFGDDHLGSRLAALVDGELSHDDRDRALGHLAGCAACRTLVESDRTLKGQLDSMAMPEPSARLMAALFQIPQTHGRRDEDDPGDGPGSRAGLGAIFGRGASSFLPEFAVGLRPIPPHGGADGGPGEEEASRGQARFSLSPAGRSPLRPEPAVRSALRPLV